MGKHDIPRGANEKDNARSATKEDASRGSEKAYSLEPEDLSLECYAVVYRPHNGFANYSIATLKIEKGKLRVTDVSDPYAAFEARARLELMNNRLVDKMMQKYPSGFQHV